MTTPPPHNPDNPFGDNPPPHSGTPGQPTNPDSYLPQSGQYPAQQDPQTGGYQQPYAQQPTGGYGQPGYQQHPAYGATGFPAGPSGPGGPGGPGAPWGEPPKKSKTPWIIGIAAVALVAVVATVLIIVLGKDDDDKKQASGGGDSGGGASLTCEEGDYGLKVDPESGESIECDGGYTEDPKADAAISAIEGTWSVETKITSISDDLTDETTGKVLGPGDTTWGEGPHEWMVITPYCTGGTNCGASVTDITNGDYFELTTSGDTWVSDTTRDITCGDSTTTSIDVTIEIELLDSDVLTGTMSTSGSPCDGTPISIEEDLVLEKQ